MRISRRALATYAARQLADGASAQHTAQQLVAYLAEQRRTGELELIIRDIEGVLAADYGALNIHITSAFPLETALKQELANFAKASESAKVAYIASETLDEDLIGGVVLRTPTRVFDNSIKTQLKQLRSTM